MKKRGINLRIGSSTDKKADARPTTSNRNGLIDHARRVIWTTNAIPPLFPSSSSSSRLYYRSSINSHSINRHNMCSQSTKTDLTGKRYKKDLARDHREEKKGSRSAECCTPVATRRAGSSMAHHPVSDPHDPLPVVYYKRIYIFFVRFFFCPFY